MGRALAPWSLIEGAACDMMSDVGDKKRSKLIVIATS